MRIKEITWQMGNDFYAIMKCEHCQHEQELKSGYHDSFYHTQVIPGMECEKCGKSTNPKITELKEIKVD